MKVTNIDVYLDGGTISVSTDDGCFCLDDRLTSTTPKKLFIGSYPEANSMSPDPQTIQNLKSAVQQYILSEEGPSNVRIAEEFLKYT